MKTDYEYFQKLKKNNSILLERMVETFTPPDKDKTQYMKNYVNSEGLFDTLNGLYYTYIMYLTDTISSQFLEPIINFIHTETSKDKIEIQDKLLSYIHEALFELNRDEYEELRYRATKLKNML